MEDLVGLDEQAQGFELCLGVAGRDVSHRGDDHLRRTRADRDVYGRVLVSLSTTSRALRDDGVLRRLVLLDRLLADLEVGVGDSRLGVRALHADEFGNGDLHRALAHDEHDLITDADLGAGRGLGLHRLAGRELRIVSLIGGDRQILRLERGLGSRAVLA